MSNKIDLSKCVVGQKCVRRDGEIARFIGMSGFARYPYNCECGAYTRDGKWSVLCCANDRDIIAVLPMEESKAEVHVHIHHYHVACGENMPLQPAPVPPQPTAVDLSKCSVGQKLKRRDGKIVTFGGSSECSRFPYMADGETYTKSGTYWTDTPSCADIVEVLPYEDPKPDRSPEKQAERMAWVAENDADVLRSLYSKVWYVRVLVEGREETKTQKYPTPEEAIDAAMAGKWEE